MMDKNRSRETSFLPSSSSSPSQVASRQLKPLQKKLKQLQKERAQVQEEREDREEVNHAEISELKGQEESIRTSTSNITRSGYTVIVGISGMNGSEPLCRNGTKTRWQFQWMY